MALTPDDIVNHEFNLAVRGYAKVEVDDLLDRLADQIERAEKDLAELRDRVRAAEERAQEASQTETTLKRTLVTAEDVAQRTVDEARSRADALLADAERDSAARLEDAARRAEELLSDAQRDAAATRQQAAAEQSSLAERVRGMAEIEERYRGQLRELLESQLRALGELEAWGPPGGDEVTTIRDEVVAADRGDDLSATTGPESHEAGVLEALGLAEAADDGRDGDEDEDEEFPSFTGLKVRVHTDETDPA